MVVGGRGWSCGLECGGLAAAVLGLGGEGSDRGFIKAGADADVRCAADVSFAMCGGAVVVDWQ